MEWVWNIEKPGEKGRKMRKKNKREKKEGENYKTENGGKLEMKERITRKRNKERKHK